MFSCVCVRRLDVCLARSLCVATMFTSMFTTGIERMCAWRDRWRFRPRARLGIYLLHFYAVRSHCVYHYIYYRYRENVCLARSLAISAASSSGDLPPPVLPVRGWMEMMVSMRYFVSELSNATAALRCRPKTYSERTHSIVREHIL